MAARAHLLQTFARKRLLLLVGLGLLLVCEVALLGRLQYSRALLDRISVEEASRTTDPLALGPLRWDPRLYAGQPRMAPFAALTRKHCPDRTPLETARCLGAFMATKFQHGMPSTELFEAHFDPVEVLNRHLAGAPGHCVSRSAILATALLASGMPARMVQLVGQPPGRLVGHNAIEVYDPAAGWVFFDPTFGGEVVATPGAVRAIPLFATAVSLQWVPSAPVPGTVGGETLDGGAQYTGAGPVFTGHVVYPEPWLYTRVGPKLAPAPFQARFLVVGPASWTFSTQGPLRAAIVLTLAVIVGLLAHGALGFIRAGRPAPRTGPGAPPG